MAAKQNNEHLNSDDVDVEVGNDKNERAIYSGNVFVARCCRKDLELYNLFYHCNEGKVRDRPPSG